MLKHCCVGDMLELYIFILWKYKQNSDNYMSNSIQHVILTKPSIFESQLSLSSNSVVCQQQISVVS